MTESDARDEICSVGKSLFERGYVHAAAGTELRAVMLERLEPNVWHSTPALAMAVLEELEEAARLWSLSGQRAAPLGAEQIDQLRVHFGTRR